MAMTEETVPDETHTKAQAQTSPFKPQIVWTLAAETLLVHIGGLYGLWLVLTFQCTLATAFWTKMATTEETVPDETNKRAQAQTGPYKPQIVWTLAAATLLVHFAGLYGLWLVLTFQCTLATTLWSLLLLIYAGVSVTMGAHRLWSHRSFKATTPLKIFLLIGETIAGQLSVWKWAKQHRLHHKYSDTDADPHNASRGFWFSHIGWYVMRKHPEVKAKEKLVDMSDIEADPWVMRQKKYYKPLYVVFALLIPVAVPCLCWGETFHNALFVAYFCRFVVGVNGTLSINSVAHLWGTRPYTKDMQPVESAFVSFVSQGEGWHNYHHSFPWDCNAAEFGKHFNITGRFLQLCERLGLAYDLRYASPEVIRSRAEKRGDGTWVAPVKKE